MITVPTPALCETLGIRSYVPASLNPAGMYRCEACGEQVALLRGEYAILLLPDKTNVLCLGCWVKAGLPIDKASAVIAGSGLWG